MPFPAMWRARSLAGSLSRMSTGAQVLTCSCLSFIFSTKHFAVDCHAGWVQNQEYWLCCCLHILKGSLLACVQALERAPPRTTTGVRRMWGMKWMCLQRCCSMERPSCQTAMLKSQARHYRTSGCRPSTSVTLMCRLWQLVLSLAK